MFSVFISLREKKYLIVFTKQFKFASPCIKDLAKTYGTFISKYFPTDLIGLSATIHFISEFIFIVFSFVF